MGAQNGDLMSIFSCSILLCSLLLVMDVLFMRQNIHGMLVSLLQMPFSCTFAACHESNLPRSQRSRHETIVSGNGFQ